MWNAVCSVGSLNSVLSCCITKLCFMRWSHWSRAWLYQRIKGCLKRYRSIWRWGTPIWYLCPPLLDCICSPAMTFSSSCKVLDAPPPPLPASKWSPAFQSSSLQKKGVVFECGECNSRPSYIITFIWQKAHSHCFVHSTRSSTLFSEINQRAGGEHEYNPIIITH